MNELEINQENMLKYFEDFDSLSHKFLNNKKGDERQELLKIITGSIYDHHQRSMDVNEAMEIFRTMDKVYHYSDAENIKKANLLEQTLDKFLGQYVDIDGMHELFRSSFFYFEWMMHLEYMQDRHDYSYYRDHYLHQVRNLYEMFLLLDDAGLWKDCMKIYRAKGNLVANHMADSVKAQLRLPDREDRFEILKLCPFSSPDEWCYHYIIFSTAIVSSLVHDIGYPIAYMKRNLHKLQDFLPMSNLFMGLKDGIPRIKSLLSNSLLFQTVDNREIMRRLNADDHGTYSAIILLCQYYDNGKIFSLEPAKRMVIELSALVIYNHTLRYEFQDKEKYDRYQNVFTDNPISYLFRLCDDMQEWERVYFQITEKSSFFICDKCKTLMIRKKNKPHKLDAAYDKMYEYTCSCAEPRHTTAVNTVWFPYRRLINVAPFTELDIKPLKNEQDDEKAEEAKKKEAPETEEKKGKKLPREEQQWILELKCDKKALLQLARYNPSFAMQRLNGIRELQAMVYEQTSFPCIFVKSFISNNPIAIKVEILKAFLKSVSKLEQALLMEDNMNNASLENQSQELIKEIKNYIDQKKWADKIYQTFCKESINLQEQESNGLSWDKIDKKIEERMKKSIDFYLFLAIFCTRVCEEKLNLEISEFEEYKYKLNQHFEKLAREIANQWNIMDGVMVDLITDCLVCMYSNVPAESFFAGREKLRSKIQAPLRKDICDLLKKYTSEEDYEKNQIPFDYYSDYFLYFSMDCLTQGL